MTRIEIQHLEIPDLSIGHVIMVDGQAATTVRTSLVSELLGSSTWYGGPLNITRNEEIILQAIEHVRIERNITEYEMLWNSLSHRARYFDDHP